VIQAIDALAQTIPLRQACALFAFPRSTLYRRRQPKGMAEKLPRPTPARALSAGERSGVREVLNSERFQDCSPREVYATLLDEGVYYCSLSTLYRLLADHDELGERRQQRQHPAYAKPEWLATGPNQLCTQRVPGDITKLLGPTKWLYYYLYVLLDVYSRYVVGWLLAQHESTELAKQLVATSCEKQPIVPGQLTLHADRGPAMTAKSLAQLLDDLGVTKTHSRPYTANDNPFSEAQFKTMKYRPDYPARFADPTQARTWAHAFFGWYNNDHHHTSLGLLTPAILH
jgi:transposase InsO family protein